MTESIVQRLLDLCQSWHHDHFLGELVLVSDHPLSEAPFADVQDRRILRNEAVNCNINSGWSNLMYLLQKGSKSLLNSNGLQPLEDLSSRELTWLHVIIKILMPGKRLSRANCMWLTSIMP